MLLTPLHAQMPLSTIDRAYAQSLFDHRMNEEIRPARTEQLKAVRIKHQGIHQFPPSGTYAHALMQVEVDFAKRKATAWVECLLEAYRRSATPFDTEAFSLAVEEVRTILNRHQKAVYESGMQEFRRGGSPVTQDVEQQVSSDSLNLIGGVFDRILGLLRVRRDEWYMETKAAQKAAPVVSLSSEMTNLAHTNDDLRFEQLAVQEARKSVAEDERPRPKVGALVVKNGQVLAAAHRGEYRGEHAEYIALERKLRDIPLAGATVYTTLEPCTERNDPKVACAFRLVERKIKRVVIGMSDPNPVVLGKGLQILRAANIEIQLFSPGLMSELEELNREFIREFRPSHKKKSSKRKKPKQADPVKASIIFTLIKGDTGGVVARISNLGRKPVYLESVTFEIPNRDTATVPVHRAITPDGSPNDCMMPSDLLRQIVLLNDIHVSVAYKTDDRAVRRTGTKIFHVAGSHGRVISITEGGGFLSYARCPKCGEELMFGTSGAKNTVELEKRSRKFQAAVAKSCPNHSTVQRQFIYLSGDV